MPTSDTEPLVPENAVQDELTKLSQRAVETCAPTTAVRAALLNMRQRHIGSIVVVDEQRRPLGILTLRDVVDRIVLEPDALDAPIARFMSSQPLTLPPTASAYQAALTMVRHGVRHVILTHDEKVAGIVSERDLFGLQSTGVRHLSAAIKSANDLPEVESFGREICELARRLVTQGAAVGPLTAFVSSLIDLLTERIVDLEFKTAGLGGARVCWIVMGSEGRSEQTLLTDQDNGIVFETAAGEDPERMRARLLPIAKRINLALDRAGYRLCPGDIMAGNPQWCLTLPEWRDRFARWIDSGSPEALLHGSIFFDLRALTGDVVLASTLRSWLMEHAPRNPRFLHQMATNALRNSPALGFFKRFALDAQGTFDLKMNAATPFVDAGRLFSLARGIDEVGTEARLRRAGAALEVPVHEVDAWIDGFHRIQGMRLQRQARCIASGLAPDNRIDPRTLNEFDREVLRLALLQGRRVQQRLALDYSL